MSSNKKFRIYDDDLPLEAEEAYNEIAHWYSARKRGSYEFKIQLPAILSLLGNLREKSLIDIACGPGAYSAEFVKRGADVLGLDISLEMLVKAKHDAEKKYVKIALQKADAHSLPFRDDSFDVAVLILTILNSRIVKEAARVLRPGGLFLFSDTHPIIESKGRWEGNNLGAGRVVEDYFSEDKREWEIEAIPGRTIILKYYSRTLEKCTNIIADAGFDILRIAEPKPRRDVKKTDSLHYDRCSRVPYFILYLARKRI